jgi:ABC-2 type transport system permease protein
MELNAIATLSHRDLLKFFRDPARIVGTLIFPLIFVGIVGRSFQSNLGAEIGFDFIVFTFTGVYAQTLFQSTSLGIISLIEDRENDFSQEIFISPISRYTIILGKIVGETLVAIVQGIAITLFGLLIGVPITLTQALALIVVALPVCLFGGVFGIVILGNLSSQRAAQQIFPFFILPQFFLAGVFNPIQVLPWYFDILSRLSPMRYAVDLTRNFFYVGHPDYEKVVLDSPLFNLAVMTILFLVFLVVGTFLFVRSERNR